jgi:anti-anti-sigma factor
MQILDEGNRAVIKTPECCTMSSAKPLLHLGREALQAGKTELVIDLSETETIDSSSIGFLVALVKDYKEKGVSLVLRGMKPAVFALFQETELDKVFTIQMATELKKASVDIFASSAEIKLEIAPEMRNTVFILHLNGVMQHPAGSRYLNQQFLLGLASSKRILLDFEDLTFFDSLSISVILSMNKLLKKTGGEFRICSANCIVQDLFNTLNINQIIPFFNTLEEALADWKLTA